MVSESCWTCVTMCVVNKICWTRSQCVCSSVGAVEQFKASVPCLFRIRISPSARNHPPHPTTASAGHDPHHPGQYCRSVCVSVCLINVVNTTDVESSLQGLQQATTHIILVSTAVVCVSNALGKYHRCGVIFTGTTDV